jgi:hypothetical protein
MPDIYIAGTSFFRLRSHNPTREEKVGRPWRPPTTKGEVLISKYFGGEVVEGKKMLFQAFN